MGFIAFLVLVVIVIYEFAMRKYAEAWAKKHPFYPYYLENKNKPKNNGNGNTVDDA